MREAARLLRRKPPAHAHADALLKRRAGAVDTYAQRVLRDAEPRGQLLAVVYLGAPVVAVVVEDERAARGREPLQTLFEALVPPLVLLRLIGAGGRRPVLRRRRLGSPQPFLKDLLRHAVEVEARVAAPLLRHLWRLARDAVDGLVGQLVGVHVG